MKVTKINRNKSAKEIVRAETNEKKISGKQFKIM